MTAPSLSTFPAITHVYARSSERRTVSLLGGIPSQQGLVRCQSSGGASVNGASETTVARPEPRRPDAPQPERHGQFFLWSPFYDSLVTPLSMAAFVATCIDAVVFGRLPLNAKFLAGAGMMACYVRDVATSIHELRNTEVPCKQILVESGAGVVGRSSDPGDAPTADVRGGSAGLTWSCASMRGWRRAMEDEHVAIVLPHASGDIGVFAVFDGHGGWQVSAIAKELLVRILTERLQRVPSDQVPDLPELLSEAVTALDAELLAGPFCIGSCLSLKWLHPFTGVGSTLCLVAVDAARGRIVVSNTGDSRAILCRSGSAVALSEDHKPEDPLESARVIRAGGRVMRAGPCFRIDGCLNLSRALGDFKYKSDRSLPMSEQKIVATPAIISESWSPEPGSGDEFLVVACDGLFERFSRQDVVDFVGIGLAPSPEGCGESPEFVLQALLHRCCAQHPYEMGTDNETAIIVRWNSSAAKGPQQS